MDMINRDAGPTGPHKWGDVSRAGYQVIPDALFIKQHELGLDQTDVVVLLNLTSYWWYRDLPPFPRTNVIAKRMGVTARTVQRVLRKLEEMQYIRRDNYTDEDGSTLPAVYLDGLVKKLESLAKSDGSLSLKMLRGAIQQGEVSVGDVDDIPF